MAAYNPIFVNSFFALPLLIIFLLRKIVECLFGACKWDGYIQTAK